MVREPLRCANAHDIHQVLLSGSVEHLRSLLDLDTVTINKTVCGTTALSLALYRRCLPAFRLILDHRFTRNRVDFNKLSKDDKQRVEPPLVTACRLRNEAAVEMLLRQDGIDVEITDNFGHTALWVATSQRSTGIVRLLIARGADVNPSRFWTHSPLFFAVRYSSNRTGIARVLIENGASVDIVSSSSSSLLYCAILQGNVNIAKLIVAAGYWISRDTRTRTELDAGSLTRNSDLIGWLRNELSHVSSLQQQCRSVVRRTLSQAQGGRYFLERVHELPLPSTIYDYIALRQEVGECSFTT